MRLSDVPGHLADNLSDTTNEAFIPNYYPLLNHHMRSARYRFSVSADHFHMYRHHDNRVQIQGECKESLNLPKKRIPWAFFHSPFQADFLKRAKIIF